MSESGRKELNLELTPIRHLLVAAHHHRRLYRPGEYLYKPEWALWADSLRQARQQLQELPGVEADEMLADIDALLTGKGHR
jgi:hypothetical protein